MVCWCFPKRQICSQKMIFANYYRASDGPLNYNLQTYVLSYLLREKTICEHCMMPIPIHTTNFVSRLGVIRFVCKKTGDPNSLLGDDNIIWKWERSRPDFIGPQREVTSQRTKMSREDYKINFKIFLQTLLFDQCLDKLPFFGVANWTCCYWYEREQVYSIIPPRTFVMDGNPNFEAKEPRHGTSPLLLKYGSFGSQNIWTAVGIDLHSRDLPISDDHLGRLLSAALLFLDENGNENARDKHPRVSSSLSGSGFEFSVICCHARGFRDLRSSLGFPEADYINSLQQCKRWNAQGGKSRALFVKTIDERLVLKEIQDIEFSHLDSIVPDYFLHLEKCMAANTPSCLVPILGLYEVKRRTGRKLTTVKLIVMQNLMAGYDGSNHVSYDLKGCQYSPYVSNSNASVLQDANYVEHIPFRAIFLRQEEKSALENSLSLDTTFLREKKIMDYSMLMVIDREEKVVTMGIIDYLRRYSADKAFEYNFKMMFHGHLPTVVPPAEYQERFMKSTMDYFPVIPI